MKKQDNLISALLLNSDFLNFIIYAKCLLVGGETSSQDVLGNQTGSINLMEYSTV